MSITQVLVDMPATQLSVTFEFRDEFKYRTLPVGHGTPACRCYRCGKLLTADTVTVDRVVPGAHGGTYRRNNIRPACASCNSETGATVRSVARRD